MFAYVRFLEDNQKDVVPVAAIKNFSPELFNAKSDLSKKFKIKWKNSYYFGTVIYIADTEEQLNRKIESTRTKIPPATLAVSATEDEGTDSTTEVKVPKTNNKNINVEDTLNRKLETLRQRENVNAKADDNKNGNALQKHSVQKEGKNLTVLQDHCVTPKSTKLKRLQGSPLNTSDSTKSEKRLKIDTEELQMADDKNGNALREPSIENEDKNVTVLQDHSVTPTGTKSKRLLGSPLNITPTSENRQKVDKEALGKENILLRKQIAKLREKNEENEKMIGELTALNIDLQRNVISQFDEFKATITPFLNNQLNVQYDDVLPPVGFKRQSSKCIHLGLDIWLPIQVYESILLQSRSPAQFVKNIATAIFGIKTLKESSVTGKGSNRNKNIPARPKLDPNKMLAIKSILHHWLTVNKNFDEASVDYEAELVWTHVTKKIAEYNKKDKVKPGLLLHLDEGLYEETTGNKDNEGDGFDILAFNDEAIDSDEINEDQSDDENKAESNTDE